MAAGPVKKCIRDCSISTLAIQALDAALRLRLATMTFLAGLRSRGVSAPRVFGERPA